MSTWSERIRDLQKVGMTQQEIGEHIGLATSTVSDIANKRSKAPGGEAAVKLHELHMVRCGPPHHAVAALR